MIRPSIIAIFDSIAQEIIIVTTVRPSDGVGERRLRSRRERRLRQVVDDLATPLGARAGTCRAAGPRPIRSSLRSVARPMAIWSDRAKEYIRAGDVFQVVPSHRFAAPFELAPFALYRSLRRTNPSPFLFYLNYPGFQLVGSSPEILVRLRDGKITIRPIAGTRRRGATPAEDMRAGGRVARRSQGARRTSDASRPGDATTSAGWRCFATLDATRRLRPPSVPA